jgi:hypothetical protein
VVVEIGCKVILNVVTLKRKREKMMKNKIEEIDTWIESRDDKCSICKKICSNTYSLASLSNICSSFTRNSFAEKKNIVCKNS